MRALAGMDGVAGVLVLWQIASLVYPMTWSFYCIAQLGWTPAMIGASLAAVGVMIALGQAFVVGPAVARFGEPDEATPGILVAGAGSNASAFTTPKLGRASCRARVCQHVYISEDAVSFKKKQQLTQ